MKLDKTLISRRFSDSIEQYNTHAVVQKEVAQRLASLIERHGGDIKKGMEIGSGSGFLTTHLLALFPDAEWYLNDISSTYKEVMPSHTHFIVGDAEHEDFPDDLDLIASSSTVQWFQDVEAFVDKCKKSLVKGGIVALATYGEKNFSEIKACTGNSLDYYTLAQFQEVTKRAGFEIIHAEEELRRIHFDSPTAVLRHMKLTGVNAIRPTRWSRADSRNFERKYIENFSTAKGVSLTFHPLYLIMKR